MMQSAPLSRAEPTAECASPQPARVINILYIIDVWRSPGGTERHLYYLLSHLDPERFRCNVIVFDYAPNALIDRARERGVPVLHLPVAQYYTPNAFAKARILREYIRQHRIDLVQTFHYKADVYGSVVARLAGVRHIVSSKRDAADYKNGFHFFLHKLVRPIVERYIAVSDVVADVIEKKEGVRRDKIQVIHNGVDLANYAVPDSASKARARVRLNLGPDDFVIGMSAWFRAEKDHRMLIDAFLQVREKVPSAKLLLVGHGPLFDEFQAWVRERDLEASIKLVGAVDDVREYLAALDVACLVPKINEGFSNSVLEKMATGLPLIVTDVGGNREAVVDGQTGFVIQPGDRMRLVELILRLYFDPALRQRLGAAARVRVQNLFSLEAMIARHAALYESLIANDRRNTH